MGVIQLADLPLRGGDASAESSGAVGDLHKTPANVNPALKGMQYVIYPRNKPVQAWDMVMIAAIWYVSTSARFGRRGMIVACGTGRRGGGTTSRPIKCDRRRHASV